METGSFPDVWSLIIYGASVLGTLRVFNSVLGRVKSFYLKMVCFSRSVLLGVFLLCL